MMKKLNKNFILKSLIAILLTLPSCGYDWRLSISNKSNRTVYYLTSLEQTYPNNTTDIHPVRLRPKQRAIVSMRGSWENYFEKFKIDTLYVLVYETSTILEIADSVYINKYRSIGSPVSVYKVDKKQFKKWQKILISHHDD